VHAGQSVRAQVVSIEDGPPPKVLLSTLGGDLDKDPTAHVGEIVDCTVTSLADFGAFVRLPDGWNGLIHISQLADGFVSSVGEIVQPGDAVRARVLTVVLTPTVKIALSLKGV